MLADSGWKFFPSVALSFSLLAGVDSTFGRPNPLAIYL